MSRSKGCKLSLCHRDSHKNGSLGTKVMELLASDRSILWDLALVVAGCPATKKSQVNELDLSNVVSVEVWKDNC